MSDYLAFGAFLAAALAGAAFSVDGDFALALALAGAAFLAAPLGAFAALALSGAGFSVGVPVTSLDFCSSATAFVLASFAGAAELSAFGAAFLASLWSPIATIFRIVCCWR